MKWLVLAGALLFLLLLTIRRAKRKPFLSEARSITLKILDSPLEPGLLADLNNYVIQKGIRNDLDNYIISLLNTEIDGISLNDLSSYRPRMANLNNILIKLNFKMPHQQLQRIEYIKRKFIDARLSEFESKLAFFTQERHELLHLLDELGTELIDQEKARINKLKRNIINTTIDELENKHSWSSIEEIRLKLLLILLETELTSEEKIRIDNLTKYKLVVDGKYKPINCIFYAQKKEAVFFETKASFCRDRRNATYYNRKRRQIGLNKVAEIDNGDLLLTDSRVLFKGRKGVLSIPLDRISDREKFMNGVRIDIDTKEREYFLFSNDAVLFCLLLDELRQYGADYGQNDEDGLYYELNNNDVAIGLCYEILGLNPAATKEEVISAYRQRAKKYHPDVRGDHLNHDFFVVTQAKNKILEKLG
jgi:hypothetical protein